MRTWFSALCWLSPHCVVGCHERESIGLDGGRYEWTRIYVGEFRDGILTSVCDFDAEFEAQAFAYAEELMRTSGSRLAVTNEASQLGSKIVRLMQSGDLDAVASSYSDQIVYDDRRRLSGDPIVGLDGVRKAFERLREQYSRFEVHTLAVRGQRLQLAGYRWSDEAGNQSSGLAVIEIGDNGRIVGDCRFDEDDFEGAYGELERRYYAGEGAAAARSGLGTADLVAAMNRADFDTMFADYIWPDLRIENRSRSAFPDRSAAELRASFIELHKMVGSVRSWFSSIRWLSSDIFVGHLYREGVGHDGERFSWDRILVGVAREGRVAMLCEFDDQDEDAAFAYAHATLGE